METTPLDGALATLRPALTADGFDLRIGETDADDEVQVILEAMPGACADCLVPDSVIVKMLEDAIEKQSSSPKKVTLVKVGFDADSSPRAPR